MTRKRLVCFSHGKESGAWGTKIKQLALVAEAKGFTVVSIDYSDLLDPDLRVQRLLNYQFAEYDCLVLVGSSMGGYVSTVASEVLKPTGLFVLAPAFYIAGYANQNPVPHAKSVEVIHGWSDEVIPVSHSIKFAQQHQTQLHLMEGDHRLTKQIPLMASLFGIFLDGIIERDLSL